MKYIILVVGILVCLAATRIVLAQSEGTIDYEMKVNMHRSIPPERAQMKELIQEFNVHKSTLTFSSTESLYANVDEDEDEEFGDEAGHAQVRIRRPMNEYYFNHATGKRVAMMEFLGKFFLIEDSIRRIPWKLGTETKTILGYLCNKATWLNAEKEQNVVAWYATKLPPSLGPETFIGLPGAILEIDINDGERAIIARTISTEKLRKGAVKAPAIGEKSTEEAFRKTVEDHRKRMGGNGNVIIRN